MTVLGQILGHQMPKKLFTRKRPTVERAVSSVTQNRSRTNVHEQSSLLQLPQLQFLYQKEVKVNNSKGDTGHQKISSLIALWVTWKPENPEPWAAGIQKPRTWPATSPRSTSPSYQCCFQWRPVTAPTRHIHKTENCWQHEKIVL